MVKQGLAAILVLTIVLTSLVLFAQDPNPYLKYFPANERIDYIRTNDPNNPFPGYPKTLGELTCAGPDVSIFARLNDCEKCQTINSMCPDCCIDLSSGTPQGFCGTGGSPSVACDEYAFDSDSCSVVECCDNDTGDTCDPRDELSDCSEGHQDDIPYCQRKGCPDASADFTPSGGTCQEQSGEWFCLEDNLMPVDDLNHRGCKPLDTVDFGAFTGYDPAVAVQSDYYEVVLDPECDAWNELGLLDDQADCYNYTLNPDFENYIDSCGIYADNTESCVKDLVCCQQSVCSEMDQPGIGNCDMSAPNPSIPGDEGGECTQRLAKWNQTVLLADGTTSQTCQTITATHCLDLEQAIQNCIYDKTAGGCGQCFREIDPPTDSHPGFRFNFVARSGQSMVIQWSIDAETNMQDFPGVLDVYFFTMVKIYEEGVADPVFESIIHQKSFTDNFSIYNAAAIDAQVLKQGRKYSASLEYYIPDMDLGLEVTVKSMSMTALTVRE